MEKNPKAVRAGKKSRAKGSRGELELAQILSVALARDDIRRTPNSGGLWIPGDLSGVPIYHVECKRWETVSIPAWRAQAERDCPAGKYPTVMYRKNGERWSCDLALIDFLSLWMVADMISTMFEQNIEELLAESRQFMMESGVMPNEPRGK